MNHPKNGLLCLAMFVATGFTGVVANSPPRPNILVFYVDDMGWGSIGPNGQSDRVKSGKTRVKTPNLDRLAAAGVNFVRGYGCTVCSPARSSLQTGFHQGHTFADRNDPDNAKKAIRRDDPSIGQSLASVGYATGYWGKWGYGGSKKMDAPVLENIQTLPTSHGYAHVLA
ncbi:MAG: sulfatase-like hydrolase/transferase, partial [Planctomycetota bacterium]